MIAIFFTLNIFAMPINPNQYTSVDEVSALLPVGVKQSKVTESARARGEFFLNADLIIKNNGDGTIGALAVGYTRFPVDEASERWRQVNYYEQEFYAKDYPDGLITPTVDVSFINQPKGYYYRLRGVFAVVYNGEVEAFSPTTDGVLLD